MFDKVLCDPVSTPNCSHCTVVGVVSRTRGPARGLRLVRSGVLSLGATFDPLGHGLFPGVAIGSRRVVVSASFPVLCCVRSAGNVGGETAVHESTKAARRACRSLGHEAQLGLSPGSRA